MIYLKKYVVYGKVELALGDINGQLCLSEWVLSKTVKSRAQYLSKKFSTYFEYRDTPLLNKTASQLDEYLQGTRREFDLPLIFTGTDFQNLVWETLLKIPYGQTWSYKQLAENVGCPGGFRAVANSNSRNPLPFIVPCHRVIANNGTIGGYSLGLELKRRLLGLEMIVADNFELIS